MSQEDILLLLRKGCFGAREISGELDLGLATVHVNLRKLRDSGLLSWRLETVDNLFCRRVRKVYFLP